MILISIVPAYAIGNPDSFEPQPINIEGRHVVSNNELLKTGRHTFILTAEDNAPLPADSENGEKRVTIGSNEPFSFGEILFEKQGTYNYRISREAMNSEELEMDNSVYICTVTVFADGTSAFSFNKEGETGKPDEIVYSDVYVSKETTTEDTEKDPDKDTTKKTKEKQTKARGVKTGDDYAIFIFSSVAALSLFALALLRKRKK